MDELDEKLVIMDEDGLHVKSPKVAEKLAKKNISASMITGLNQCAAKWLADSFVIREIIEEEPDNAARRGSLFHKVMEDFFALEPEDRTKAQIKDIVTQTFELEEFADMNEIPDVHQWLRGAINNYYSMGSNPQKVQIAEIAMEEGKDPKKGLEIFVKGKIGSAKREVLGFIDRLSVDLTKDDGSVVVEDWKGLALNTLLPTPEGWTTMEKVQIGDKLLGANGKTVNVLNKSDIHNRPCYKIEFMDGSTIVCDNVHLWNIHLSHTKSKKSFDKTVDADELYELWKNNGRDYIQIKNPQPIKAFTEKSLPIDPYILGVWLGDGRNRDAEVCSGKDDADEMVQNLQEKWSGKVRSRENKDRAISIVFDKPHPDFCAMGNKCKYETSTNKKRRCDDCRKNIKEGIKSRDIGMNVPLTTILKREGLTHNKHVPLSYLRGSYEQRLELLQGLMDTDGSWHPNRRRAVFTTTTKELSDAVAELVASFGMTPTTFRVENDHKGFYEVNFLPVKINPFKLKRKAKQVEVVLNDEYRNHKALHRYIRNIEQVDSVPTQCIKVDSEDSLYLCGKLMTPTHNTGAKVKKWKSHTKSDEGLAEQRQQLIYKILLENKGIKVSGARLIYPVAKEVVNVDFKDVELLKRVIKDVEETDKALDTMIETNTFEYTPSFLCSWCPLIRICPKGIVKPYQKMQDAFAKQPEPEDLLKGIELR